MDLKTLEISLYAYLIKPTKKDKKKYYGTSGCILVNKYEDKKKVMNVLMTIFKNVFNVKDKITWYKEKKQIDGFECYSDKIFYNGNYISIIFDDIFDRWFIQYKQLY